VPAQLHDILVGGVEAVHARRPSSPSAHTPAHPHTRAFLKLLPVTRTPSSRTPSSWCRTCPGPCSSSPGFALQLADLAVGFFELSSALTLALSWHGARWRRHTDARMRRARPSVSWPPGGLHAARRASWRTWASRPWTRTAPCMHWGLSARTRAYTRVRHARHALPHWGCP